MRTQTFSHPEQRRLHLATMRRQLLSPGPALSFDPPHGLRAKDRAEGIEKSLGRQVGRECAPRSERSVSGVSLPRRPLPLGLPRHHEYLSERRSCALAAARNGSAGTYLRRPTNRSCLLSVMRLPSCKGPAAYDPAVYELFRRFDYFHLRSLAQHARRGLRAIDQQDELPQERPGSCTRN